MLKVKTPPPWSLVLPALGLLAACSSYSEVRDGTTEQPGWPSVGDARPVEPRTVRPDLDKLRKVQAGMSKTDIYALIGHPQYREGMAGVQEWDFVFLLPDGKGGEPACQYKILYDDAMLAKSFYWQPQSCADLLNPPPPPQVVEPPPPVQVRTLDLSTDTLFEFDSARLRPEGARALEERVISALTGAKKLQGIRLIGYADRLGSDSYNLQLSQRRADAVKAYLISSGVPANSVQAEGRGEAEPMVTCQERERSALIGCLAPNRRVRVEITVDK
ncbi:MAG TPA: OmpA family protein [Stenotrophomonas sp.]|nr:OmpA family protein [Stenotrophomonas sp.]